MVHSVDVKLIDILRRAHYSVIVMIVGIALFPTAIAFMISELLPASAIGVLLGTGIALFANGLAEFHRYLSSTTTLKVDGLSLEIVGDSCKCFRVSLLIYNGGRAVADQVKAVMSIDEPNIGTLRNLLVDCNTCRNSGWACMCSGVYGSSGYLVNQVHPVVKGYTLSWALPERPILRPAKVKVQHTVFLVDYTHITSIAPFETARLLIFEFVPLNSNRYLVRFFSEYGAPPYADECYRPYRLCMFLDGNISIRVRVSISGNGLREQLSIELRITKDVLDRVVAAVNSGQYDNAVTVLQELLVRR